MVQLGLVSRPEWMTDAFLKTSIRNLNNLTINANLKIVDVILSYLVPKGENYMSLIWRAEIKYEKNSANNADYHSAILIIKVAHETEDLSRISASIFSRETDMYENIIPALHTILNREKTATKLACRSLNTIKDANPRVLVLEDLNLLGYSVADRKKGLDLDHCKIVLHKLAQLHAASMQYFIEKDESEKSKYCNMPFFADDNRDQDQGFLEAITSKAIHLKKLMSKERNKYEKACNYLDLYLEHTIPYFDKHYRGTNLKKENKFYGIVHLDCWINNIMFKYQESGLVNDALFVDWQAAYYGSVVGDFLYFIMSSSNVEIRKLHFKHMRDYYYEALIDNLNSIGYLGLFPTLEEFCEELKVNSGIAMMALFVILPLILTELDNKSLSREDNDAFNLNEIIDLIDGQSNTKYDEIALESFLMLQNEGILDDFSEHLD